MDDYFYLEEIDRLPIVHRPKRTNFEFMEMSDFEFFRFTRFTKDGVTQLTERIQHRIRGQARGAPITPLNQVYLHLVRVAILYRCCG